MTRHDQDQSDEQQDDSIDPEAPDEADMDESDDPELIDCPHCGKSIGEEAEWCHHCGNYVIDEANARRLPLWVLIVAAIAVVLVLTWMF